MVWMDGVEGCGVGQMRRASSGYGTGKNFFIRGLDGVRGRVIGKGWSSAVASVTCKSIR